MDVFLEFLTQPSGLDSLLSPEQRRIKQGEALHGFLMERVRRQEAKAEHAAKAAEIERRNAEIFERLSHGVRGPAAFGE